MFINIRKPCTTCPGIILFLFSGCDKPRFNEERRVSHDSKSMRDTDSSMMEEVNEADLHVRDHTYNCHIKLALFLHNGLWWRHFNVLSVWYFGASSKKIMINEVKKLNPMEISFDSIALRTF